MMSSNATFLVWNNSGNLKAFDKQRYCLHHLLLYRRQKKQIQRILLQSESLPLILPDVVQPEHTVPISSSMESVMLDIRDTPGVDSPSTGNPPAAGQGSPAGSFPVPSRPPRNADDGKNTLSVLLIDKYLRLNHHVSAVTKAPS